MNKKKIYKVIGIVSILLSIYRLIDSIFIYFDGPSFYNPNMMYLLKLPRYYFFIQEWISMTTLLVAGISMLINKRVAFYLYNFFFVGFLIYLVSNFKGSISFTFNDILDYLLLIFSIFGIFYVVRYKPEKEFNINRRMNLGTYVLFAFIFFTGTYLPIMFC
jgi:hypothetical protein